MAARASNRIGIGLPANFICLAILCCRFYLRIRAKIKSLMPSLTTIAPSAGGGGLNFNAGGGGGGSVSIIGAPSSGGTLSLIGASGGSPSGGGSGSASSIAASVGQFVGAGGGNVEGAFYDQRLAEIYYLGDKPWSDESRYDDPFAAPSQFRKLKTTLILLAALCLAKNL